MIMLPTLSFRFESTQLMKRQMRWDTEEKHRRLIIQ